MSSPRIILLVLFVASIPTVGAGGAMRCTPLELPIWRVEGPPQQYAVFCAEEPEACDLSGPEFVAWAGVRDLLRAVNAGVNADVRKDSDLACSGLEEKWSFPVAGWGDCEDFALEKRRRLVERGVSSAALTMAIVHHEVQFFPHAVLLAETSAGTIVLDDLVDDIVCWDAAPYRWERRERPDGRWERFALP